jgi:hypothetical protein
MAKPRYTAAQKQRVMARAMEAVEARIEGHTMVMLGKPSQLFALNVGGMCNRFVRQTFETALGLPEQTWVFRGTTASDTLDALSFAGYEVHMDDLQPGDILGHTAGKFGHIALYVGDYYGDGRFLVAENTSWTGGFPEKPGTKITRLATFLARGNRWRAYRLFPEEG